MSLSIPPKHAYLFNDPTNWGKDSMGNLDIPSEDLKNLVFESAESNNIGFGFGSTLNIKGLFGEFVSNSEIIIRPQAPADKSIFILIVFEQQINDPVVLGDNISASDSNNIGLTDGAATVGIFSNFTSVPSSNTFILNNPGMMGFALLENEQKLVHVKHDFVNPSLGLPAVTSTDLVDSQQAWDGIDSVGGFFSLHANDSQTSSAVAKVGGIYVWEGDLTLSQIETLTDEMINNGAGPTFSIPSTQDPSLPENVDDPNAITKVSNYLRPFGSPQRDYFNVDEDNGLFIDVPNFNSFAHGDYFVAFDAVLREDEQVDDFSQSGFMRVADADISVEDASIPTATYKVRVPEAGEYFVAIRTYSPKETASFSIFEQGEHNIKSFDISSLEDDWFWMQTTITIPTTETHEINVGLFDSSVLYDALYVGKKSISDVDVSGSTSDKPFTTIHARALRLDDNNNIIALYDVYDYKNNIEDILNDNWYNFNSKLKQNGDDKKSISPFDKIAWSLTSSGSTNSQFIVWDAADQISTSDPYTSVDTATINRETNNWIIDSASNSKSIKLYSNRNVVLDNGSIGTPPADIGNFALDDFDRDEGDQVFINTKLVVNENDDASKVELDLPDRVVTLIIDQSGSMTWNDNKNLRHEMSRRMINRVESTYPGDVAWNIYTFQGTPIRLNFFAVVESDEVNTNNLNEASSAFFADQESGYAGIRLVRKQGSPPANAVDGDIIQEGFFDRAFDTNLTEGTEFYYKVFTQDVNGTFSEGIEVSVVPRERDIPSGIGQFTADVLRGTGVILDNDVTAVHHLDEGNGNVAYDFTSNQLHLKWQRPNNKPLWLNDRDTPSGESGVRFSFTDDRVNSLNHLSTIDSNGTTNPASKITVMAWIYPIQNLDSNASDFAIASHSRKNINTIESSWAFAVTQNGSLKLTFGQPSSTNVAQTADNSVFFNGWNHVAFTHDYNQNETKFYVNGEQVNTLISGSGLSFQSSTEESEFFIGRIIYNLDEINPSGANISTAFGKITEVSVHKTIRDSNYIFLAGQIPESVDAKIDDNGDRLTLLRFTVPDDFDFPGGRVRIVSNEETGVARFSFTGNTKQNSNELERVFDGYGFEPFHAEDGDIIYDEPAVPGSHVVSVQNDFVHGRVYNYKLFSENAIGNFSNWKDSPVLSINTPGFKNALERSKAIDPPSPDLVNVTNVTIKPGNRKLFLQWMLSGDSRIDEIRVYYSDQDFPVVEDGFRNNESDIIFRGKPDNDGFVHRNIDNNIVAFYSVFTVDKNGHLSEPIFVKSTPREDSDESGFPLLEARKLRYEIVDENSLSIQWEQPVRFQKEVKGWFDQRIALFAQITDEFGAPIADDSNIKFEASLAQTTSSELSEDVFGGNFNKNRLEPDPRDTFILTSTPLGGGTVKGSVRMVPDFNILSAINELFLSIQVKFEVPKPGSSNNLFEFNSIPITIALENPFQMSLENFSRDQIQHICKAGADVSAQSIAVGELQNRPDRTKQFNGTFVRRQRPFVARVRASYRGQAIRNGGNAFVVLKEASDPDCDREGQPPFEPTFFQANSRDVLLPASTLPLQIGFEEDEDGRLAEFSFVDIPLQPPRLPQGVMLFSQVSFNGFFGRKRMYIAFENILQVQVDARSPAPDCQDVAEQFATAFLIDPDSPDPDAPGRLSIPDSTVMKWELGIAQGGKNRPFFSLDNVPIAGDSSTVFSFVRNSRARRVFFGPACGVKKTTITAGGATFTAGENYVVKSSVSFDGLSNSDEDTISILPPGDKPSFGLRLLMELPRLRNQIFADGFDVIKLTITKDPNQGITFFARDFMSCAKISGEEIIVLNDGQFVDIEPGDAFEIFYGEDLQVELDPYTDEIIFSGGQSDIGFASVPMNEESNITDVYLRINRFIGPRPDDNGELIDENICSAITLPPRLTVEFNDRIISGSSNFVLQNQNGLNETKFLIGGGGYETGIPPTVLRLQEPLSIQVVDIRRNGESVEEVLVDGKTEHQIFVRVRFSDKPVPDGTPVLLEIGGKNPNKIAIDATTIFTTQVQDDKINEDGEIESVAVFTVRPLNPVESFSAQIQAETKFDKRGDIDRSMTACVTISYDASTRQEDDIRDDDQEEEEEKEVVINNVFDGRLFAYDTTIDKWLIANNDMNNPRGGLALEHSFDAYGEKLFAIGGLNGNAILSVNEEFDLSTGDWSVAAPMPTARMSPMSVQSQGYIYIIGGITVEEGDIVLSREVEKYDPFTDSWEILSPMPIFNNAEYHIAFGSAINVGSKIYIVGGVQVVDTIGGIKKLNDRILVYDIDSDSWTASDPFEGQELEIYQRLSSFSFYHEESNAIVVASGAIFIGEGRDQELEFIRDSIAININDLSIALNDFWFDDFPVPRYKGGSATVGDKHYMLAGMNEDSNVLKFFEEYDASIKDQLKRVQLQDSPISRQSFGMTSDEIQFIYVAGGITSGRPSGFLQIKASATPSQIRLNGLESAGIDIELVNDAGQPPDQDVRVLIRGFLILPFSGITESTTGSDQGQQSSSEDVDRQAFVYPVQFSSNDLTISNGFGSTRLLPRSDDILRKVGEIKKELGINDKLAGEGIQNNELIIKEGEVRRPYKIRIQLTVVDDFFFGQTVVDIADNEDPDIIEEDDNEEEAEEQLQDDEVEEPIDDPFDAGGNNISVDNIFERCLGIQGSRALPPPSSTDSQIEEEADEDSQSNDTGQPSKDNNDIRISEGVSGSDNPVFDFNPTQKSQLESPTIQYISDIEWIPQVVPKLTGNNGSAAEAFEVISRLDNSVAFGASPLYDGVIRASRDLLENDTPQSINSIYVHTDNEQNLSFASLEDAIFEVQSVDGFGQTPVVANNFSIVFPVTLSALVARTDTDDIELLSKQTGGESKTILDRRFINEVLNDILGRSTGAVGWGIFETTIDIGVDAVINTIFLDYTLFDNTDGNWQVSSSRDGVNFTDFSDKFNPEDEVKFDRLSGRFFRFRTSLVSGLSASVSEEYEMFATPGAPSLEKINVNYSIPKESFIFLNTDDIAQSAQQVALSVKTNESPNSIVQVGAAPSDSFNWRDFIFSSQPEVEKYGKIYIPIRTQQEDTSLKEPLINIDRFIWKTTYGEWDSSSSVVIRDSVGSVISKDRYEVIPRDGLVIFNNREDGPFIIDIENKDRLRLGIRILNRFASVPVGIFGVGYMYNTNAFLPPPLTERPPEAISPVIVPSNPFIYSKINATYRYFDLNRDPEDLDKREIRWFINGVEDERLRDLVSWNDVTNTSDPIFTFAFSFSTDDIPSGVSIEQFAREKDEKLIDVGDEIHFTLKVSDGKVFGKTVRSPSISVVSAPPFVTRLDIKGRTSSGQIQDSVTTATTAFVDFNFFEDGGENTSTIIWFVNGEEFKRGPINQVTDGFSNNELIPGESVGNTNTFALAIGNEIEAQVVPSTESQVGNIVTSESKTVANAPPVVTDVLLTPNNPPPTSNLQLTFIFSDNDINIGTQTQDDQSSIRWLRKSVDSVQFEEVSSIQNQETVSSVFLNSGDQWKAEVIPFDGVTVGSSVESNIITVQ